MTSAPAPKTIDAGSRGNRTLSPLLRSGFCICGLLPSRAMFSTAADLALMSREAEEIQFRPHLK
jgi:hypothetical protein